MARLTRREATRIAELQEAARQWTIGAPPLLATFTSELRDLLNADRLLTYGLELGDEHLATTFAYGSGIPNETVRRTMDDFLSNVEPVGWTYFNPLRPEKEQRNAPLLLSEVEALVGRPAAEAPVQTALVRFGVNRMDQLRVLVCDEEKLLAVVCAYREGSFGEQDRSKLLALTPSITERLRVERDFEDVPLLRHSLDVALEAICKPAFIVRRNGGVEVANSAGRELLEKERAATAQTLKAAARGVAAPGVVSKALCGREGGARLALVTIESARNPEGLAIDPLAAAWGLTPRERAVLALLAVGKSNKAIAIELECAPSTVEIHVSRILAKAGVLSRAELLVAVWRASRT